MFKATIERLYPKLRCGTHPCRGTQASPQQQRRHITPRETSLTASPNLKIKTSSLCNCRTVSSDSTQVLIQSDQRVTSNNRTDKEQDPPEMELYTSDVKFQTRPVVPGKGPPPELPTTCCQSGCANCVWIQYAEDIAKYYKDGGAKAKEAISKIEDANLRAFIMLEVSDIIK